MDLETLIDLERSVWDALQRGDASADSALLAADFLGVYPTGFAERGDHSGQLNNGPTIADYEIHSARSMHLSADHALLAYKAEYRRPGTAQIESMYVSSLWSRRAGRWVNVFSQDTPEDPAAAVP